MCDHCGCHQKDTPHTHPHGHDHEHVRDHEHGEGTTSKTLVMERKILSHNDETAARNRAWLTARGITAINLISSPGSGKTTLLERTLDAFHGSLSCAVITGDQQTDNDARRLQNRGAAVRQIETRGACHLDAEQVGSRLPEVCTDGVRLLFIENVGNLVCPSAFDLGEHFKVALLSTTEGEDKPIKYPTLFTTAPVVVLTKMDLVPHLDWNAAVCRDYLRRLHPGVFVFELSARTGAGMEAWLNYLRGLVA